MPSIYQLDTRNWLHFGVYQHCLLLLYISWQHCSHFYHSNDIIWFQLATHYAGFHCLTICGQHFFLAARNCTTRMSTRGDKYLALGLFGVCLLLGLLSGHTACAQDTTPANSTTELCSASPGIRIDLDKVREWFGLCHSWVIPSCECVFSLQAFGGRLLANLSVHISAPRLMWRC